MKIFRFVTTNQLFAGYYQTTDAGVTAQPFGNLFPLAFSLQQCMDIYGLQGPNVNFTNTYYGGKTIATSNTVFVNGLIDPWHILSVTTSENQSDSVSVIVMESTAHCGSFAFGFFKMVFFSYLHLPVAANMYPPSPNDPAEVNLLRTTNMCMCVFC
jgi:hypothetical protein